MRASQRASAYRDRYRVSASYIRSFRSIELGVLTFFYSIRFSVRAVFDEETTNQPPVHGCFVRLWGIRRLGISCLSRSFSNLHEASIDRPQDSSARVPADPDFRECVRHGSARLHQMLLTVPNHGSPGIK